jgi:hypothetical protein
MIHLIEIQRLFLNRKTFYLIIHIFAIIEDTLKLFGTMDSLNYILVIIEEPYLFVGLAELYWPFFRLLLRLFAHYFGGNMNLYIAKMHTIHIKIR